MNGVQAMRDILIDAGADGADRSVLLERWMVLTKRTLPQAQKTLYKLSAAGEVRFVERGAGRVVRTDRMKAGARG